jgi:hypothetical protein
MYWPRPSPGRRAGPRCATVGSAPQAPRSVAVLECRGGRLRRALSDEDAGAHGRRHGKQADRLGASVGSSIGLARLPCLSDQLGEGILGGVRVVDERLGGEASSVTDRLA